MNSDAALAAALFAVDPAGLGGTALRSPADAARDDWLALLRQLLPENTPWRRVPLSIQDNALLGGLDLGATLQAGRPMAQQGVLASAHGGVLLLPMAERLSIGMAARLSAVLDQQEVVMERDGLALRQAARVGMVALDEGVDEGERLPAGLLDRLAFHLVLQTDRDAPNEAAEWQAVDVARARERLPRIAHDDAAVHALCAAAHALGIDSMRAPWFALRAARAAAALAGTEQVEDEHIALAARLVLAPRATRYPTPAEAPQDAQDTAPDQPPAEASPPAPEQTPEAPAPEDESVGAPETDNVDKTSDPAPQDIQQLAETVLAAAQAAIPAGLLASLKLGAASRARAPATGRSGAARKSQSRGRPIGARRGEPRAGARLNVMETLRAAAPWQRVREMQQLAAAPADSVTAPPPQRRIQVRREDFHVSRFKQKSQTTTVFVVDASGSSALNRLAEAKGAVELLLADCYVRRDQVAVLAFRGKDTQLLLPPTRSLARAKRSLAGLPGGGGTPLASALDAARELADQIRRRGETPILVLLTDGRANIARDGSPGRAQASADALAAANELRIAGFSALLIDTAPQPQASAQALANAIGGRYLPLPHAGAQAVSQAVRLLSASGRALP